MDRKSINIVYPIGVRCYTNQVFKELNLIRFSSIFSSLFIKSSENFITCIKDLNILFDEKHLVYRRKGKYGYRTLHRLFDNLNRFHSAFMPHHDYRNDDVKEHFQRGIGRLEKIKKHGIPTLFVQLSEFDDYDNSVQNNELVESIKNSGYDGNVLSICTYKPEKHPTLKEKLEVFKNQIVYTVPGQFKRIPFNSKAQVSAKTKILDVVNKYYDVSNLASITDIDALEL